MLLFACGELVAFWAYTCAVLRMCCVESFAADETVGESWLGFAYKVQQCRERAVDQICKLTEW